MEFAHRAERHMYRFITVPAGAPELVRSSQKDRFYTGYLNGLLSDAARQFLPLRRWIQCQRELQLLAELAYYGLTTVYGNQTLGEEYCNIVQVSSGGAPSTYRRAGAVLIQALGPYLFEKLLEHVHWKLTTRAFSQRLSEETYERLTKIVGFCEETVSTLSRLHLAVFYLRGIFYEVGKRMTSIRYVALRYSGDGTESLQMNAYKTLGWLILLQVVVELSKQLWKRHTWKQRHIPGGHRAPNNYQIDPSQLSDIKCPLCLEQCTAATTTLCGHIFCWQCAAEWTSEKMECPLCRRATLPHELVPLQHFAHI